MVGKTTKCYNSSLLVFIRAAGPYTQLDTRCLIISVFGCRVTQCMTLSKFIRRAELAPQNKLKMKIIEKLSHFVFHSYNEKVRQLKVCAPPWPPKKNTLFVTNFQCGKAIFWGGQGGAKRMCKIASCNSQMSGTYIQKPYPHFKKMHAKR